jgi:hypothetical protein
MESLLLLGIIPGTNIQIDFGGWLLSTVLLALVALTYTAVKKHVPLYAMIFFSIYFATYRAKLVAPRA